MAVNDIVHVQLSDLPVHCPFDDKTLYSEHPRVFIELTANAPENVCPYCSTRFKLDLVDEQSENLSTQQHSNSEVKIDDTK